MRRRAWGWIGLAAWLAAVGVGGSAGGQPIGEEFDSLEWMAADSSVIVRGVIVGMEIAEDLENSWRSMSFRVDETLKGEPRPEVRFVTWSNLVEKDLDRWKEQARPLLVFLDDSRCVVARYRQPEYGRFPLAPRSGYRNRSFVVLAAPDARAYTQDLRALTDPEAILKATRAAIAEPPAPGKPCGTWLRLPGHGDLLRVTVPVAARLEAKAREWARSEDRELRDDAIMALLNFRSDQNAAILRGLLDDPSTVDFEVFEGGQVAHRLRAHLIAEEAHHVLRAWGYDVPPPVPRVKLPPAPKP